jgi:hypothetical protein
MVDTNKNLSSLIGQIEEELSNSNFPFKVDIVHLSDFAESYRPSFEKDKLRFQ